MKNCPRCDKPLTEEAIEHDYIQCSDSRYCCFYYEDCGIKNGIKNYFYHYIVGSYCVSFGISNDGKRSWTSIDSVKVSEGRGYQVISTFKIDDKIYNIDYDYEVKTHIVINNKDLGYHLTVDKIEKYLMLK